MVKRKLQVSSEEEDDSPKAEERKQKQRKLRDEEERDEDLDGDDGGEEEEEDVAPEDAKPIGEVIKVSSKGRKKKKHYNSFEYDGGVYELEDSVLLIPEDKHQKPYVAIIKDITQDADGSLMVTGQWFYRPEEAEKKGGGGWQARDTRELFYSFHLDDVPAESVMHKCVVHFVPLHKKFPLRKLHPGFIVQKVYDVVEKKLWKLTDKDYEDHKQHEIDLLVQKTKNRIGDLPDIEPEDAVGDHVGPTLSKRSLRRKNMHPIDVSKSVDITTRSEHLMKTETPGSCTGDISEYNVILAKFKVLTGEVLRDRWLEKLLSVIHTACESKQDEPVEDERIGSAVSSEYSTNGDNNAAAVIGSKEKSLDVNDDSEKHLWPDTAVQAVTALEKASHEALGSDFQKYNQKMRQMVFNLKNNMLLARRLLNKELDPVVILNMSPNELKDGLTTEEKTTKEPEETKRMQMTDARCSRCTEKKVGVADIIHAGGHGDRYQLECMACGHTWYASRDAISSLTFDARNVVSNVGTAPWATAKFEDVEKKLVSPREPENSSGAVDIFRKSTAAYMPVLETQKSFRSKAEGHSLPAATRE